VGQRGVPDEAAQATAARAQGPGDGTRDIGIGIRLLAARVSGGRRRDDAGRDSPEGSLMRHFLPAGAVVRLASGVMKPSAAAVLVASTRRPQRRLSRLLATRLAAVAVATVAPATEEKDAAAVDTRADDKAKRIQAPPRSGGRAGHARGDMR